MTLGTCQTQPSAGLVLLPRSLHVQGASRSSGTILNQRRSFVGEDTLGGAPHKLYNEAYSRTAMSLQVIILANMLYGPFPLALVAVVVAIVLWNFMNYVRFRVASAHLRRLPGPPKESYWSGMFRSII